MTKITPVEDRISRLLDSPLLARVVPHLAPEILHHLIRARGLDACSEIITAATPAQLTSVLDLDLWNDTRPGRDEQFDVTRFGEWLEALIDTDESFAARTVAALDRDVVVAGLSRYVRVLDPGIFEPTAQSDDEAPDRHGAMREGDSIGAGDSMNAESMPAGDPPVDDASGGRRECDVGGYTVRARRTEAWDAIVALLVALEAEHGRDFHAVMQACRRLSNSRSELDGLDELLPAPEQHLHDATIAREQRRSQQGYATPADARAFLQMARQPAQGQSTATADGWIGGDPIVTAYFRAADAPPESPAARHTSDVPTGATDELKSIEGVMELLTEAGLMPRRPRALLEAAEADPETSRLTVLRQLMAVVRDTHEAIFFQRSRELGFLANTLLAGCSVQSRSFTPQEASDAAAAICNLGLEHWPSRWPGTTLPNAPPHRRPHRDNLTATPPETMLVEHDLVTAFQVGWSVLHQDVSLFATDGLIAALADVECVDRDVRQGLAALRRALRKERGAGTPWRARGAVEVLSMLDPTVWISVLGLLDECPVVPAALTAVVEGRTTRVSPTVFEFISTAAQIDNVRIFMRKLPDLLSR